MNEEKSRRQAAISREAAIPVAPITLAGELNIPAELAAAWFQKYLRMH